MSYHYRLSGAIRITPPLNYTEMTKASAINQDLSPMLADLEPGKAGSRGCRWSNVKVRINTTQRVTDTGVVITYSGDYIEPHDAETSSPEGDLDTIARAFSDHTFAGYIYGTGESGDHMRWSIKDGRVVEEEARLVWPDGEVVKITI